MARRKDPDIGGEGADPQAPLIMPADDAGQPVVAAPSEPLSDAAPESSSLPREPAAAGSSTLPARRSGVLGPVLGGAIAALGGFGLSHFNLLGLAAPDQTAALAALDQRLTEGLANLVQSQADITALQAGLATLDDRLAVLETVPAATPPDLSRLDGLDARLAAIEALPTGGGDASTAALAAKLAELERRLAEQAAGVDQGQVDAALARLEAAQAEAAAAAAGAEQAAALDRLRDAVATGGLFEAELAAVTDPALTQALQPHVAGAATLADLQATFPEAARQTLTLARTAAGEAGWGTRIMDFLTAQTGARSLTPREGTDPDAILSRAEFALGEGQLADALAELGTLDPAFRIPFDGWTTRAAARLAVDQALDAALESR